MKDLSINKIIFIIFLSFGVGLITPAIADAAEKKDKGARRAQILLLKMKQESEAEKVAMQKLHDAEKKAFEDKQVKFEEEIEAANNKLNVVEGEKSQLNTDVKKLTAEKTIIEKLQQQAQAELATIKIALTEQKQLNAKAQAELKFNDNQRKTPANNLSETTKAVNSCEVKNRQLHKIGSDLIQIYNNPNTYDA